MHKITLGTLKKAVEEEIPGIRINSNLSHYSQECFRNAQKHGLSKARTTNVDGQNTKLGEGKGPPKLHPRDGFLDYDLL